MEPHQYHPQAYLGIGCRALRSPNFKYVNFNQCNFPFLSKFFIKGLQFLRDFFNNSGKKVFENK